MRPLYRVISSLLAVLPVDEAGRRVFDETLADWRREAGKAKGGFASAVSTARSLLAVLRSVAGVSVREVTVIRHSGVLPRLMLWTLGYVVVINLIKLAVPGGWPALSPMSRFFGAVPLIAYFLPIALLLAAGVGGRRRPLPTLGLSLSAILVAIPLLGWGVPVANRAMYGAIGVRQVTPSQLRFEATRQSPFAPGQMLLWATTSRRVVPYSAIPFVSDLTVPQLIRQIVAGPALGGWPAIQWLSFFGAYVALCALAPMLAGALRRRAAGVRYGVLTVTALWLMYQPGMSTSFGAESVLWWFGMYWVPVVFVAATLVMLTMSRPRTVEAFEAR